MEKIPPCKTGRAGFTPLDLKSPTFQSGDERNVKFEYTKKPRALARGLTGFTLLEMVIVVVILGILATISVSQYMGAKEQALDREAQANLKLILAAERVYRMENSNNIYSGVSDITGINDWLKLLLPDASSQWDYFTKTYSSGNDFCAQATRRNAAARAWRIRAPSSDAGRSLDPLPENDSCP